MDGAIGVVSLGAETVREASALCCPGGSVSLAFDGAFAFDVSLEGDSADSASAAYVAAGLGGVINEGKNAHPIGSGVRITSGPNPSLGAWEVGHACNSLLMNGDRARICPRLRLKPPARH